MAKQKREMNSLEQAILGLGKWYRENRDKALWGVFVFLVAFAAILFFRFYVLGGNKKVQNTLDDAYYISTAQSLLNIGGGPDPAPWKQLAEQYGRGEDGALIRVSLGEAQLKTGQVEVIRKVANSRAEYNDEAVAALTPDATYQEALKAFDEVLAGMTKDQMLVSRAAYDAGAASESLASIAAADAVEGHLTQAAEYYKKAANAGETAYGKLAAERIAALAKPITVTYYKQTAERFAAMPVPPARPAEEPAAADAKPADAPLDPNSDAGFEILNELPATDAVPAPEDAPATDAAPATEETPAAEK